MNCITSKDVMKEVLNSKSSTWTNYTKWSQHKSTDKPKSQSKRRTINPNLHWNSRRWKPTHLWLSVTWNWRTLKSLRNTWMNTTAWPNSPRPKTMSPTVLTTWQSYLNKRTRAKRQSNSTRRILRQPSHRNRTRRTVNLWTRPESLTLSQSPTRTWKSTLRCSAQMTMKVWERFWTGKLSELWSESFCRGWFNESSM